MRMIGTSDVPGSSRRTSTPLRAASTRLAYSGAGARPHPRERRVEGRHGRSADDDHRVAPARPPTAHVAGPLVADAETARYGLFAVHDEQLAVVANECLDGATCPDWTERADVHSVAPQLAPIGTAGAATAERIV